MWPHDTISFKKKPTWLASKVPGFIFYSNAVWAVIAASRLARRGLYSARDRIHSSLSILKSLEYLGTDVRVENLDMLSKLKNPCVFVSNHMSVLETFIFPCLILPYKAYTVVLKHSLMQYPVFKHVLRSLDPIVVGRTNPRQDFRTVMEEGLANLKNNISVLIFPQTTRALDFDPAKFNTLGIKLAKRAKVPVIPVAVKTDAWGIGKWVKDLGRIDPSKPVRVCFGEPVHISGAGKTEHRSTIDFIAAKLACWE
ncbi:MAG: 1-acyl-sn-glycerol-3-phosphate acyltransferase [Deltaproteobacteria bacterium]|nr:1-acyl-sn-glycerol-3-phosphate acyltransferase [Deltaproteobacteria bacterium]